MTTCLTNEAKPLIPHLNPNDALTPQLRVNRGESPSKSVMVDNLLDDTAQLLSAHESTL